MKKLKLIEGKVYLEVNEVSIKPYDWSTPSYEQRLDDLLKKHKEEIQKCVSDRLQKCIEDFLKGKDYCAPNEHDAQYITYYTREDGTLHSFVWKSYRTMQRIVEDFDSILPTPSVCELDQICKALPAGELRDHVLNILQYTAAEEIHKFYNR